MQPQRVIRSLVLGIASLVLILGATPLMADGAEFIRFDPGSGLTINFSGGGNDLSVTLSVNNGDWLRQGPDGTVVLHGADNDASILVVSSGGDVLLGEGNFSISATFDCALFDPDAGLFAGCTSTGEKLNMSLHGTAEGGGDEFDVFARWLLKDGESRKVITEVTAVQ